MMCPFIKDGVSIVSPAVFAMVLAMSPVHADSYANQDLVSKLENSCQVAVADVTSAKVEPGEFEDHNYFYKADVIESWQMEWDSIRFSLTQNIGVGGKVVVVVNECSQTSDFGDLSIGLGQEVYSINRMLDLYDNEWWVEVPVGTHDIPDSWRSFEVTTRYSGEYRNSFLESDILVPFERLREILDDRRPPRRTNESEEQKEQRHPERRDKPARDWR